MIKSLCIIIPFFNEEKRIKSCLEKINKIKKKNIEFILVNDGSYDKSIFIVKKFLKRKSNNIKLINLKTSGNRAFFVFIHLVK